MCDLHPEDTTHVYREKWGVTIEKVKIPEGSVKCPDCHGSGKVRYRYSEPGPFNNPGNDWINCFLCMGKGFIELDYLKEMHPEIYQKIVTQKNSSEESKGEN